MAGSPASTPRYLLRNTARRRQRDAATLSSTPNSSRPAGTRANLTITERALPRSTRPRHPVQRSSQAPRGYLASVIRSRRSRRGTGIHRKASPAGARAAPADSQRDGAFPSESDAPSDHMSHTESLAGAEGRSVPLQPSHASSLFGGAYHPAPQTYDDSDTGPSSTSAPQPVPHAFFHISIMDSEDSDDGGVRQRVTPARGHGAAVLDILEGSGYGLGSEAAAILNRPGIAHSWRGDESPPPDRRKSPRRDFAGGLCLMKPRAMLLYDISGPGAHANDVWPNLRTASKRPARYYRLEKNDSADSDSGVAKVPAAAQQSLDLAKLKLDATGSEHNAQCQRASAAPSPLCWPAGIIPTEIYEQIAGNLCRDDVKAMRLVCREFDTHVSQVLFKTAIVPFNSEIYGMLTQGVPDPKGKKKVDAENSVPLWGDAGGDDIFTGHGLDVFRGFGGHILKFGMSFEVDEDALAAPPSKCILEPCTGFWGNYDWPYQEYCRYPRVAGLETTADETPRMIVAFSELTKVRELALSVDSGLGWLNGPDRSIRSQVLRQRPEIFGCRDSVPERQVQAQNELWSYLQSYYTDDGADDIKSASLCKMALGTNDLLEWPADLSLSNIQPALPFLEQRLVQEAVNHERDVITYPIHCKSTDDVSPMFPRPPGTTDTGILCTIPRATEGKVSENFLIPNSLTPAQNEWLMETDWAQRAFLSSYLLSVMDNPVTFESIHTLNIARLSDRYLPLLNRHDFWEGLPNLNKVTIRAIPSWRNVYKDHAGFVHTPKVHPSSGINPFFDLLKNMVCPRLNISHLTIGWAGGGEHAEGYHARNRLLLPPPILRGTSDSSWEDLIHGYDRSKLLLFPHVETLELENCWMTPNSLVDFVKAHDGKLLKELTLRSFSLTAIPRPHQAVANPPQPHLQTQWHHVNQVLGTISLQTPVPAAISNPGSAPLAAIPTNPQNANTTLSIIMQQNLQIQIANAQGAFQNMTWTPAGINMFFHQLSGIADTLQQTLQQFQQEQPQLSNPGQPQLPQSSFLQQHIQQLNAITAIVQQLHQPLVLAGGILPGPPPGAPPSNTNTAATHIGNVLHTEFRRGSWVDVIDQISPGRNLSDFGSELSRADPDRITSLETINFISCGYAVLPHYPDLDQRDLTRERSSLSDFARRRREALSQFMLSDKYPLLGVIVQTIEAQELEALDAGWDFEEGWKDTEAAEGPEFDGELPGGTGRFTGVIRGQTAAQDASTS